ncbi:MAG: hypothetical protein HIU83_17145 [Proteobacteria bacterium]|nr:hypothetical protein [Pseudomonadota bacterium]
MAQKSIKKTVPPASSKTKFLRSFSESQTFNISDSCKAAAIGRRTFYNWLENDQEFKLKFDELKDTRDDAIESAIFSRAVAEKDTTALIFLCKTLLKNKGYVEGGRISVIDTGPVLTKVIDSLMEGQTTIDQAAFELTKAGVPLPESIKIMLGRFTPSETESVCETISVEHLERRYNEALAASQAQREFFLPERRIAIQKLKEELAHVNSFAEP